VVFGRVLFVEVLCLLAFAAAGPGAHARPADDRRLGAGPGPGGRPGALYRARDAEANAQALQFALKRETLQRQATDAQLAALQSQIDYVVKPVDPVRLAETVQRLQQRLGAQRSSAPSNAMVDALLERLAADPRLRGAEAAPRRWLQWIKASVGHSVRLIPVEQVAFLRSDEKYTLVVWDGGEALIRTTSASWAELDPDRFAQIHRSVIVNRSRISQVTRGLNETADVHLAGRSEVLPVSRSYLHLFRQM